MDSLLIDLLEIKDLFFQINNCSMPIDEFIENNNLIFINQDKYSITTNKLIKQYVDKTYDYPDYIKQYFYDELDIKIFIGLIYRINSLKNLQNLQDYSHDEAIQFRAVRILNAGFNNKKIFIALLIKEFLNSK